jgi:hypothetical protein
MRKLAVIAAVVVALWLTALVVLDFVLADRQARGTADRLGEALQATTTIDAADLALVRGHLALDGLAVRRDDAIGQLSIDVAELRCDLPPLGWALVDDECRELAVRGTRLQVSTVALFQLQNPKRPPIRAHSVVIDDAQLTFAPSAFVPGLGSMTIAIEHAEAGATVFRTPLSWLFSLAELTARLELPAGITVRLRYHDGRLAAAGTLFGSEPVELPVELPRASAARDAHEEIALLVDTAKQIAAQLVEKRAEDWLRSKLH